MPCCERSPFEAPGDRMTLRDDLVTCRSARDADKPVAADPPRERTYEIQLNREQNRQLLTWLSTNAHGGSLSLGRRLTVDTVERGGLLVRARPFRFDDRAAEDAETPE